jgi:hypothetical protein
MAAPVSRQSQCGLTDQAFKVGFFVDRSHAVAAAKIFAVS